MIIRTSTLSLALTIALVGSACAQMPAKADTASATTTATAAVAVTPPESTQASSPMVEADVRTLLMADGYTGINDVKFKEGTWTADAKSADGKHVELRIDAATRRIYPDETVATIGKDQIIVKVQDAGYTNVHGVEMEGGVWKAEANDSKGNDVEIKLDPNDGHILGSEKDVIGAKH